jgi:hypothetical protein
MQQRSPNRRIAARVPNASAVPTARDMTVHRLAKNIRREHAVHKVFAKILVIKILRKQDWNLFAHHQLYKASALGKGKTHVDRTYVNRAIHQVGTDIHIWMFLEQLARDSESLRRRMSLLILIIQALARLHIQHKHILLRNRPTSDIISTDTSHQITTK